MSDEMRIGRLREIGRITTTDGAGNEHVYECAMLVQFDSPEELREAMQQEKARLLWGIGGDS